MADCKSKEEKDTRKMNRTRDVTKGEDTEKNPKIEKGSLRKGKKTDYKKQKGHVLVYSNVSPTLVRMKAPRLPSDPSSSSSDTTPSISPSPLTEQARNRTAVTTHSQTTTSAIESDRRKRVEKASRARFYLLHKTGPTAFTVAGDSPEHKYKVMIGPQTCSCSRGLHCVHLLFVMLRVLQVDQTNPLLWSRTLKNYEVNGLLAQMQDRNRKRIRRGSSCNSSLLASSEQTADDQGGKASYTTSDTSRDEDVKLFKGSDVMGEENERRDDSLSAAGKSGKGEEEDDDDDEDICPICLLEMVDGESLTVHINGCGNSLHHHCMAIWTEEKHRQDESVTCPLCMLEWVHVPSAAAPATSVRDATPFSLLTDDEIKLPLVEPLSQEKTEEMSLWVEVFGLDVTSCLLSRKWNVRETALHRVTQKVVALLLSCASQQEDEASIIKVVEACSQIVAHRCADPVYKVFVAALEVLHAMLATIPCSNQDITVILQDTLYPVIQAIIVKAADPNRRVCNQSLLTLEELCRGQGGELAVGSAMDQCKETEGYGGLPFVLFCALSEEATGNVNWQWWQGRLALLDMLLSQFPFSFQLVVGQEQQSTFDEVYTRLCKVLEFAAKAMSIQHMRVTKLARRVFVRVIRLGAHVSEAVKYMRHLIEGLQDTHKTTLSRRLSLIVGETSNAFHNRSLDSSASFQAGSLSLRSASLEMKKRRVTDEMETKFKTDDNDKETTEETTLQVDAVSLLHGEDKMSKSETDQPDLNWETQSNSPHRDVGHGQTAVSDNVEENSHFSHSYHPVPVRNDHFCKDIEADESEAVFLAMEASQSESGLPVLSGLAPPDDLVTVHVQEGAEGGSQAQRDGSNVYVEGVHWKKGARIGTGAFCTCFLGRDIKTGALMALKQVCCIFFPHKSIG
ncbi:mitogen-activated protein kinase kinase kinase 1-like isoform X2 [Corticium candelabrum]|uniref:mitogen-activated protein kinase kinase kinase 1-like isoform X2 n=1 Tax=Corticium candelabrum TaxID=121492 RepID=UPI002E32AC0E|nr:mitogen-activated protein kinase kinase kinase 1-like isoform X2 [Corticium candelabrum]